MAKRGRKPRKGAGDVVESIAKATGVDKIAKKFEEATGKDCGCTKRKEILNKMFTNKEAGCLTQTQYDNWTQFKKELKESGRLMSKEMRVTVSEMHGEVFGHSPQVPCDSCGKIYKTWINEIDKVYDTYEID